MLAFRSIFSVNCVKQAGVYKTVSKITIDRNSVEIFYHGSWIDCVSFFWEHDTGLPNRCLNDDVSRCETSYQLVTIVICYLQMLLTLCKCKITITDLLSSSALPIRTSSLSILYYCLLAKYTISVLFLSAAWTGLENPYSLYPCWRCW